MHLLGHVVGCYSVHLAAEGLRNGTVTFQYVTTCASPHAVLHLSHIPLSRLSVGTWYTLSALLLACQIVHLRLVHFPIARPARLARSDRLKCPA